MCQFAQPHWSMFISTCWYPKFARKCCNTILLSKLPTHHQNHQPLRGLQGSQKVGFYASRAIASVGSGLQRWTPLARCWTPWWGRHLFGRSGQGTVELLVFAADFCFASFVIIYILTLKRRVPGIEIAVRIVILPQTLRGKASRTEMKGSVHIRFLDFFVVVVDVSCKRLDLRMKSLSQQWCHAGPLWPHHQFTKVKGSRCVQVPPRWRLSTWDVGQPGWESFAEQSCRTMQEAAFWGSDMSTHCRHVAWVPWNDKPINHLMGPVWLVDIVTIHVGQTKHFHLEVL